MKRKTDYLPDPSGAQRTIHVAGHPIQADRVLGQDFATMALLVVADDQAGAQQVIAMHARSRAQAELDLAKAGFRSIKVMVEFPHL